MPVSIELAGILMEPRCEAIVNALLRLRAPDSPVPELIAAADCVACIPRCGGHQAGRTPRRTDPGAEREISIKVNLFMADLVKSLS